MLKKILLVLLITLILLVPVIAYRDFFVKDESLCELDRKSCWGEVSQEKYSDTYHFSAGSEFTSGWNLVSSQAADALYWQLSVEEREKFFIAKFSYIPGVGYISDDFEESDLNAEQLDALGDYYALLEDSGVGDAIDSYGVAWVYLSSSFPQQTIYYKNDDIFGNIVLENGDSTPLNFPLVGGWNFIAITPDMVIESSGAHGNRLDNAFSECEVEKIYGFYNEEQEWVDMLSRLEDSGNVESTWVGMGMVVKVVDDCMVNPYFQETEIVAPPPIPN